MAEPTPNRLFSPGSWRESSRLLAILRQEAVGGGLLLVAAVAALFWANSPWSDAYATLRDTKIGWSALDLNLSLSTSAADGLLAIFFFAAALAVVLRLRNRTYSRLSEREPLDSDADGIPDAYE